MAKKDSPIMKKVKSLRDIRARIDTINKAAQNKQEEFELTLMDIEDDLSCNDDTLKALGRIVTRYFGITITPEIFEAEVERILAIKGVPEYIESMKPSLPYAEELAALDNLLNGNTAKADDKKAADKQSE
ncbi:MAG: hypothetical protein J5956_04435 [Ruminococcus sp.]|nr:hypothetical protein [Ruminococcus sp.]